MRTDLKRRLRSSASPHAPRQVKRPDAPIAQVSDLGLPTSPSESQMRAGRYASPSHLLLAQQADEQHLLVSSFSAMLQACCNCRAGFSRCEVCDHGLNPFNTQGTLQHTCGPVLTQETSREARWGGVVCSTHRRISQGLIPSTRTFELADRPQPRWLAPGTRNICPNVGSLYVKKGFHNRGRPTPITGSRVRWTQRLSATSHADVLLQRGATRVLPLSDRSSMIMVSRLG